MRALVVDDSKATRKFLKSILVDLGFAVEEAADGIEALERLGEIQRPDVALVDWNMPNMNGFELIQNVRADPKWNDTRLVMVTTETSMQHVSGALEAGADEYVMKPFTREMLLEKLQLLGIVS